MILKYIKFLEDHSTESSFNIRIKNKFSFFIQIQFQNNQNKKWKVWNENSHIESLKNVSGEELLQIIETYDIKEDDFFLNIEDIIISQTIWTSLFQSLLQEELGNDILQKALHLGKDFQQQFAQVFEKEIHNMALMQENLIKKNLKNKKGNLKIKTKISDVPNLE